MGEYYVAVKPDGTIMGPVGKDSGFIKTALIIGYARAAELNDIRHENLIWNKIKKLGYSVRKCEITIINGS